MPTRFLVIETSHRVGRVALAQDDAIVGERALDESRRHARDLAPSIQALLQEQGWRARELDGVIVSRGPGSYTGLRVGLISAKTLAYATRCALIGVETFAAVALQVPEECQMVDVLADAQKDQVYVQPFGRVGGEMVAAGPLVIQPFAEWVAQRRPGAWATGPGLVKWRPRLPGVIPCVEAGAWRPHPESLLVLGLDRYDADERDDVFALEPLYLRPSSAEEQWRGRRT